MEPCQFCGEPVEAIDDNAIKGPAPEEAISGYCHPLCWDNAIAQQEEEAAKT